MHFATPIFSLLALLAPQQGVLRLDESATLPTLGLGDADHATVAVNSRGDVLVAFHTRRDDLSGEPFQVEAAFLRYLGQGLWELPSLGYNHFVLGDPTAQVLDPGGECCTKPDVVAVGENFVVVWPRTPPGQETTRLEAAFFEPGIVGEAVVHAEAPGIGWLLDGTVLNGSAGVMPDLAAVPGSSTKVHVAYAHADGDSGRFHDYDVRYMTADFSSLPPLLEGPYALVEDLAFDDPSVGNGQRGGKVLPDLVVDDYGNLVLAYENFSSRGAQDEGWIDVCRFSVPGGPPLELERESFHGANSDDWTRRPMLATNHRDSDNSVSLLYQSASQGSDADIDSRHYELSFPDSGSRGTVDVVDLQYPNLPDENDRMPCALHGEGLRVGFATKLSGNQSWLLAWAPTHDSSKTFRLTSKALLASRPAAAMLEFGTPGAPRTRLIPISYEFPDPSAGGADRIGLQLRLL
ncbi:MAG TPA: hypothetical protein VGC54_11845 [Planctomycetota bacterium]